MREAMQILELQCRQAVPEKMALSVQLQKDKVGIVAWLLWWG